ncbi:hypothetical protein BZG72_06310 [Salinivibrio sp. PR6]|uniref:TMEM43 family protein n=1 Tax=Salinivibrio sp. PR6 TaxID=1909485 RepID=UPI0009D4475C|nr:TMEM43 family protein [Salinivibrio sp. PR6]OOE83284.1 hypothetical protein BZG72_06310 [Salinivibrio sp. PR6]
MSDDHITEISSQSWLSRLGGAIKGVFFGFSLFAISISLLFWNEGRAVERYKTLKEGSGLVQSIPNDRVNAAHQGDLVHLTGRAITDDTVKDSMFGIQTPALKLQRRVEMYQWQESSTSNTRKKLGGGTETVTEYSYSKGWSSDTVSSSNFVESEGHQNPGVMPFKSQTYAAQPITVGAFTLSSSLVNKLNNYTRYRIDSADLSQYPLARVYNGGIYVGNTPASPEIGDLRIEYYVALPAQVSLIAAQYGSSFQPYHTESGGDIQMLRLGNLSADVMFDKAQSDNQIFTWIIRLVGILIMALGIGLILWPISVFADVIPFIGTILGVGAVLVAVLSAFMISMITIAIAWLYYRPILAATLIIGALACVVLLRVRFKSLSKDMEIERSASA